MGKLERKERERERRRQQIIIAARKIFSDKGFKRATMEGIAKEAELILGTLYLSIEQLNNNDKAGHRQRLDALKDAMYGAYQFDPMILINMSHIQSSETLQNLTPGLLSEIKNLSRESHSEIAKLFKEGIKDDVYIDRHPNALADIIWALFSGVVIWETSKRAIDGDQDDLKDTLEVAFDIFRQGIQKKTA